MNHLAIELVSGSVAPKYSEGKELTCESVVVTEQGTEAKLPIVDFKLRDKEGNFYLLVLTGRVVNGIATVIGGVNERNHGNRNP